MSKLVLFMMVSLDGYIEGPNHDLSWHNVDQEFNEFAADQLAASSILVFGKNTYEMMASFWPSKTAKETDPIVAQLMNTMPKLVISRSLESAQWENTKLINNLSNQQFAVLKRNSKKDLLVLGSNNLCVSLLQMGLLDELRIMVNPVMIGAGTTLFKDVNEILKFKLLNNRTFKSGNVLLSYST